MRNEEDIFGMLLAIARADERIRAVLLSGSRADSAAPRDKYQDYDITFFVTDIAPYYDSPQWIAAHLGQPLIMQCPEAMTGADGDGHFTYLALFPDGVRIDLSFEYRPYIDDGESAVILLDKDSGAGFLPPALAVNHGHWGVAAPSALEYSSSCNNFWWCLGNVAKGIVRGEVPYAMAMLESVVRPCLNEMAAWHIGGERGFPVTAGKHYRHLKRLLEPALYERYLETYPAAGGLWQSVSVIAGLFSDLAQAVAEQRGFTYRLDEETAMRQYLHLMRNEANEK